MNKLLLTLIIILSSISLISCGGKKENPHKNHINEIEKDIDIKKLMFDSLTYNIKQLNMQTPIYINEYTTLVSAVVNGTTINYNYKVNFDSDEITQEYINEFCKDKKEVFKENILFLFKQNEDKLSVAEWKKFYQALDIRYKYNYIDENGKVWAAIIVDSSEL